MVVSYALSFVQSKYSETPRVSPSSRHGEFIGAAQTLGSGALLVNPFNSDEVAKAISDALAMEAKEVEENHNNLSEYVSKFTLQYWADDFVTELLTQEHEVEFPMFGERFYRPGFERVRPFLLPIAPLVPTVLGV